MLKLSDNPPALYPEDRAITEIDGKWWVGHTKARFEKAFAWDLLGREVPYFLPMGERITFSGGRRRKALMPLFPSYVFFCGGDEIRYEALVTGRLCQTIAVHDQRGLIYELSQISRAVNSKVQMDPYSFAVKGKRCRVRAGPLEGTEGVVIHRDDKPYLVLQVSILGKGTALEIEPELLEPAE